MSLKVTTPIATELARLADETATASSPGRQSMRHRSSGLRLLRHFRSLYRHHLLLYVCDVFSGQFLLGLAGDFAVQGDNAISCINLCSAGDHVAINQRRGFHLRAAPCVRFLDGAFTVGNPWIIHAGDPGQTCAVSWANDLWDSSATVPIDITTPPLASVLTASFLRYVM